jgi:hypothetical protein
MAVCCEWQKLNMKCTLDTDERGGESKLKKGEGYDSLITQVENI